MLEELLKEIGLDLKHVIYILLVLVGAFVLTRTTRWLISKSFKDEHGNTPQDPTRLKFFRNAIALIIWTIALASIIYMIPKLRALAITLFAGAGIFMAILGFAAQQAFSNIIGGVFIVIFKPFRIGDIIKVGSQDYGTVEDITLRHTIIQDFRNRRIVIPNSLMSSETVINNSIGDPRICEFVEIGISYDSDVELAIKIMHEEGMNHPLSIDNRSKKEKEDEEPVVRVRVIGYGDSSVNLRAYVWAPGPIEAREMHFDLNKSVKARFDTEGIEIPFPYRTIVYKKDLE